MTTAKRLATVLAVILLIDNSRSFADIVSISFNGTINFAYHVNGDGSNILGYNGGPQAYSGVFTFDDQAPVFDTVGSSTRYTWPTGTITVDIGGYYYGFIRYYTEAEQFITVPTTGSGGISVAGQDGPGQDFSEVSFGFGLNTNLSNLTLSDIKSLPLSDFMAGVGDGGFDLYEAFKGDSQANYQIDATVLNIVGVSVVPEPSTFSLLSFCLILCFIIYIRHGR